MPSVQFLPDACPKFDLDRIVEPNPVPEIFTTTIGYMDMIAGGCVRIWLCVEHDDRDGQPSLLELKAKIIKPAKCLLQGRVDAGAWMAKRGILVPPDAYYSPTERLM